MRKCRTILVRLHLLKQRMTVTMSRCVSFYRRKWKKRRETLSAVETGILFDVSSLFNTGCHDDDVESCCRYSYMSFDMPLLLILTDDDLGPEISNPNERSFFELEPSMSLI